MKRSFFYSAFLITLFAAGSVPESEAQMRSQEPRTRCTWGGSIRLCYNADRPDDCHGWRAITQEERRSYNTACGELLPLVRRRPVAYQLHFLCRQFDSGTFTCAGVLMPVTRTPQPTDEPRFFIRRRFPRTHGKSLEELSAAFRAVL